MQFKPHLNKMYKIICLYLILLTPSSHEKCETPYAYSRNSVCGTNGVSYYDLNVFKCEQEEYGKSVNLQIKHMGPCRIWERHGIETTTVILVSHELTLDLFDSDSMFNFLSIPFQVAWIVFGIFFACLCMLCVRRVKFALRRRKEPVSNYGPLT